jgi:phosphatidylinositol-4,5-bisphosphate 3-kinase
MTAGGLNPEVLRILSSRSPMAEMTSMDCRNVWFARDTLTSHPSALVFVLRCVDWSRYEQVQEMYALLHHWCPLPSSIALNLLGPETSDPNVRAFAVRQLESLDDSELSIFMLHLTHALKFETFVDSALARFLVRRALLAPGDIGHTLFWSLKSEMSMQEGLAVRQRFGVVIDQYLRCCGIAHRASIGHSVWFMERLRGIAREMKVKKIAKKKEKEKIKILHTRLNELNAAMPKNGIRLPLSTSSHGSSSSCSDAESKQRGVSGAS